MQQLETSKQIVEAEQEQKRECKGRRLAISRKVFRIENGDQQTVIYRASYVDGR